MADFSVVVGAGTLRSGTPDALTFPHQWTSQGVTVDASFTGAHLLHLAAAGCVLNDVYREARTLGVDVRGEFRRQAVDLTPEGRRRLCERVALATSDTGPAAHRRRLVCADLGVTQSMGAVGTSADNSLAEAFNATLKREVLQDLTCWPDEAVCRRQLFRWLVRYNTRRRHSWCRYQSPITYETTTASTLPSAA